MGNVVQFKQVASNEPARTFQKDFDTYRLTLNKIQPCIAAPQSKIESDIKVIDAFLQKTNSPHLRELTLKQLSEIKTQALLLAASLNEVKSQLLVFGDSVGVSFPENS